jgi:hypothetical protein
MTKYRGYRTVLSRNTTGSTYVAVGQVLEIGDIGSSRAQVDVSAHGDEWMDFLGGRQEGLEVTIRYAFDPADSQQTQIKSDYDNAVTRKYRLTHPDHAAIAEFTTISLGYLERPPQDGAYEAEITLKIVTPGLVKL